MVSFAVLSVVAIGFVFKFLPETKGHSVEEVVQTFEKLSASMAVASAATTHPSSSTSTGTTAVTAATPSPSPSATHNTAHKCPNMGGTHGSMQGAPGNASTAR